MRPSLRRHVASSNAQSSLAHRILLRTQTQPELDKLEEENARLKSKLEKVQAENERLHDQFNSRIVLENFEGEFFRPPPPSNEGPVTLTGEEMMGESLWCDELEDDACPVEPTVSFGEALRDRAYWLVGLLILQSCSGIILARNEALLANHPVSTYRFALCVLCVGR